MTTPRDVSHLDALVQELSDEDLQYILDRRRTFVKDAISFSMLKAMQDQVDNGVQIVYRGAFLAERRKLKPDELLKLRAALERYDAREMRSTKNANETAAANLAADKTLNLDALAQATADHPER